MHVLIAQNGLIPVSLYGGTERVIWALGKSLVNMGHKVTFLCQPGSQCSFADVLYTTDQLNLTNLGIDIIHKHGSSIKTPANIPTVTTIHGNSFDSDSDHNIIFVSKNHAMRFGSECYVHNGLDWDDYAAVDWAARRHYFHFLGKAAWRVKNVKGAIDIVKQLPGERLYVLGGQRLNLKMGFRFTLSPKIKFFGMVGGKQKYCLLNSSKGLIFPVRWHEPFGLALIESLYFGCPVFGSTHGSLTEVIHPDVGFLSNKSNELVQAVRNSGAYDSKKCHEYARDLFNADVMAKRYLEKYETVLNGKSLNVQVPKLLAKYAERYQEYR